MPPATLRRKLQKKLKRKPCWGCCLACGGKQTVKFQLVTSRVSNAKGERVDWPRLFKTCGACKQQTELFWTGGGNRQTHRTVWETTTGPKG
jgi:hypothetical protein